MLKGAIVLAGTLLLASAFAAPRSVFDGKWQWRGSAGWQRITFDFTVNGSSVTGGIRMGPGRTRSSEPYEDWEYFYVPADFPISKGKVSGNTITFEQTVVRGAGSMPVENLKYSGKLSGDRITFIRESTQRPGDAFILGDHEMEFTAERIGATNSVRRPPEIQLLGSVAGPERRISLFAAVLDPEGKPVANLSQSDFTVLEDGMPRPLQNFAAPKDPINVSLMFDHNQTWLDDNATKDPSGYGSKEWNSLLKASGQFLNHLRMGDRFALAEFESSVQTALDWWNAGTAVTQEISLGLTQAPAGQKDLFGAITWAGNKFQGVRGRKVAVLFTDGRDGRLSPRWLRTSSSRTTRGALPGLASSSTDPEVLDPLFGLYDVAEVADFNRTLTKAATSGIQFNFIVINSDRDPEFGPALVGRRISGLYPGSNEMIDSYISQVRLRLERLAGVSGGRVFYGDTFEYGVSIFEQLHKSLGLGAYSVEFNPAHEPDGQYHRLEVRVKDPKMRVVQSQDGYRYQ